MFQKKPMTRAMAFTFSGLACAGVLSPAVAQTAPQPKMLERVQITGSAIKRIEGETALPVTVITKQEIDQLGVVNAAQLVDRSRTVARAISSRTRSATRRGRASPVLRCAASARTTR